MSKTLFLQAYADMVAKNLELFNHFSDLQEKYRQKPEVWKSEFDTVGKSVVRIVDETENRLCSKMENTSKGKYSDNLADKFRSEVRKNFPLIDLVGITIN
jgi:hypothetical protein